MGRSTRIITVVAIAVAVLGCARSASAQVPIKNVPIPIIIPGGPPVMINLNPSTLPPTEQRAVQQPFTFYGLLPPNSKGICGQVTSTYLSVIEGNNQFKVFTYPKGYVPGPDIVAGRKISVNYRILDNGLLQLTGAHVIGDGQFTVTGAPIPKDNTGAAASVPTSAGVPNINVKPVNLGQ